MYEYESWTLKKAEQWKINAFELWCWRRLLRVSWTARRSNQSILKEISPEYSLKGLMLKLKLWYFGYLMRRTHSFEKPLMLRKIEGRRRGRQRMRWLDAIVYSMHLSLSKAFSKACFVVYSFVFQLCTPGAQPLASSTSFLEVPRFTCWLLHKSTD